jgi:hypothetical protein
LATLNVAKATLNVAESFPSQPKILPNPENFPLLGVECAKNSSKQLETGLNWRGKLPPKPANTGLCACFVPFQPWYRQPFPALV